MSALAARAPTGLDFVLPDELQADRPAEVRGAGRDDVRLLMSWRGTGRLRHRRFTDLPEALVPGDVLVVNTSATVPASVPGQMGTSAIDVHVATRLPAGLWLVELRRKDAGGTRPLLDAAAGGVVGLPEGGRLELLHPFGGPHEAPSGGRRATGSVRLWIAALTLPCSIGVYLAAHGRPIRYRYVAHEWGLAAYQTVFAREPGSAEMPSAGRPFTAEMVTELVTMGVTFAPLVLHTGLSSPEAAEPPAPEWYRVPAITARRVNEARRHGQRVIAIGTTPVRAIETVVDDDGIVHPAEGWTETVITPERGVRAVDGILTGWHEPRASHLAMLEAIAGPELLAASYGAALEEGYLWHEFGDVHLVLP